MTAKDRKEIKKKLNNEIVSAEANILMAEICYKLGDDKDVEEAKVPLEQIIISRLNGSKQRIVEFTEKIIESIDETIEKLS